MKRKSWLFAMLVVFGVASVSAQEQLGRSRFEKDGSSITVSVDSLACTTPNRHWEFRSVVVVV
jgi:hypothetical protein